MNFLMVHKIEKEQVSDLHFVHEDVLPTEEMQLQRKRKLELACALGNNYKGKVGIRFMTRDGELCEVYTTIWCCSNDNIMLKNGVVLPVRSITEVTI